MPRNIGLTRPAIALTTRAIDALQPGPAAYRVPDLKSKGLALRVATSGIKTWDLSFRIKGADRTRRMSLGRFADVSLEIARARASALASAARVGRDLAAEEEAERMADAARITVDSLISLYVRRRVMGRLRTAKEIESRLRRALEPHMKSVATELRRRDVRALLDDVADRGHEREAEKRRQTIGAMFRWALSQDMVDVDPTAGLASFGNGQLKDRVLSLDEIRSLWSWLSQPIQPEAPCTILKLQILLGARCGEIGGMTTGEIDRTGWIWTLPASRSKNKRARVTPLVGTARQIVRELLPEDAGERNLFTTDTGASYSSSNVGSFLLNRRGRLPVSKFTTHDLRRTVATQLVEMQFPLESVAAVIGHSAGGGEARTLVRHYVRTDLLDRKANILGAWDLKLKALLSDLSAKDELSHS
jgi:integrase